jgi:antitoxin (DNA-binding transcriptional repressor) of toxin-antitoxin stability system
MIEVMLQVHMTEAEAARDFHAVIERVREGAEVVVEQDNRPVAVIRAPQVPGRPIAECIAIAKAYEERLGYAPIPDEGFAKDVEAGIEAHREALDVSVWD